MTDQPIAPIIHHFSNIEADAGLEIQSVVNQLNLYFSSITSEYYFLVFKSPTPQLQQILNLLEERHTAQARNY